MRRLYLHIYLSFVGIVLLFGLLAVLAWWSARDQAQPPHMMSGVAALLDESLPPPGAAPERLREDLRRLAARLDAEITLHAADGRLLGASGRPLPPPPPHRRHGGWMPGHGPGGAFAIALPDGRSVVLAAPAGAHRAPAIGFVAALALLALAIGVGAYPLARRITGRLERLQARVDALGAGDLSARVVIEGKDEVAALAASFNRAAERIERLIEAQKDTLASASHELRSPLTRIRMALELLAGEERPELRDRIGRDIEELDALIEELLLASRLDTAGGQEQCEPIDLLALAAEEAARIDAEVEGDPTSLRGDPRLIRRLLRNLLENARRYGGGSAVEVGVGTTPNGEVLIEVRDRGPGVPAEERERIFQPFYRRAGMREGVDKGVGLGLALVRRIARRHGGEAECREREGGGTCFRVTLRGLQR